MYYDIFIMKEHEPLNPDYEPCTNTYISRKNKKYFHIRYMYIYDMTADDLMNYEPHGM